MMPLNYPVPTLNDAAERRPRALAVDDQPDAGRLLQLQLRAAGFDCTLCQSGADGIRFLAEHAVDVILLDVMMPDMDGYEVCRRLKENESTRDIPVLFLTAKVETEEKVRALEVGGHDYLTKPVQNQELLARTRAALRVKYLQDQLKEKLVLQQEVSRLQQDMLGQHWQMTLGQLAASLGHEINNPLAIALGSVQLLALRGGHPPEFQASLQIVESSLQRAAQKLRSLLLIARNDTEPHQVNLAELVEDTLTLVHYRFLVQGTELRTEFDRGCTWKGVPGQLGRALLALLNNACEAVEGQPGSVVLVQIQRSGNQHRIQVADSGRGIPEEIGMKAFDPFYTTKKAPHRGIGLSLARDIVLAAYGNLDLQCHGPLGGAQLTIALPAPGA